MKIRVKTVGELGKHFPKIAEVILSYYAEVSKAKNLPTLSYAVNILPKSLNHQYIKGKSWKNSGGKSKTTFRLHPEVIAFRRITELSIGAKRFNWKPTGVTGAVILFESPLWLTKEFCIRKMDADNLVKPVLDACQLATGVPDEGNWQVHFFKIPSKKTRTIVYLFDLGDVVEFFG